MRILRAADRIAAPWKNGGGITREVAAWPPGAGFDDFHWRMSLAEVHGDGPFSVFPGVDRILAVLKGRLLLRIAGRADLAVGAETPPAVFPGDAPTFGGVVEGPVHDLNLMVRRGVVRPRLERLTVSGAHELKASAAARLVIPVDGQLSCEPTAPSTTSWSPSPASAGEERSVDFPLLPHDNGGGGPRSGGGGAAAAATLGPLDAALLEPGEGAALTADRPTTVYVASFER